MHQETCGMVIRAHAAGGLFGNAAGGLFGNVVFFGVFKVIPMVSKDTTVF